MRKHWPVIGAGLIAAALPLPLLATGAQAAPTCAANEWVAQFYAGSSLEGDPLLERCDASIDYDFNAVSPDPAVPVNRFSARWTRTITVAAGTYRFITEADDGVRVFIDGTQVIDGWKDQGPTEYTADVPLTAGAHSVVIEYYEAFGDALIRAEYAQVPGGGDTCDAPNWRGEHFRGVNLAGSPLAVTCDAAVNFDFNAGSPAPAVPVNKFSSRWTSSPTFAAGTYTFTVTRDDGARVIVDGTTVLDSWTPGGLTTDTAETPLAAGVHTVVVEFREDYGDALIRMSYERTGTGEPPPGDPRSTTGEWRQNSQDMPVRSIHSTVVSGGDVLLIAGSGNNQAMFAAGTFRASLWNPTANTFTEIPVPEDMFCAGHVHEPDGRVMVAGGNKFYPNETTGVGFGGLESNYEYDPGTRRFIKLPSMNEGRWYPTLTVLGNGNIRVVGGLRETGNGGNVSIEEFNPYTKTWVGGVKQRYAFWGMYPALHLLDDGKLLYTGTNTFGQPMPGAALWNLETDAVTDLPLSQPDLRDQSASVMLPPAQDQKFMVMGGGNSYSGQTATNSTYIHDMKSGQHNAGPTLSTAKMYVNSVILPDRTVLETGGAEVNNVNPKYTTEIYDPKTNSFTSIPNTPTIDRMYHSTAVLLEDGRVAVFGSNPNEGEFEMRISIYSPPYLFKGPRPVLTSAPDVLSYGQSLTLGIDAPNGLREVSLLRPMSVTHQMDNNARLVDVPMTGTTATITSNRNLLPPGPYMLIATDNQGIPSVAKWVRVQ